MINVVVSGGYGLGNFGDDALLFFLIRHLRVRGYEFKLFLDCHNAKYLNYVGDYEVDLSKLDGESILIYGGGTVFYHFPRQDESTCKKILTAITNPFLLLRWLCLKRNRVLNSKNEYSKKILLGIGFGPFYKQDSPQYRRAEIIARDSDKIIVRDSASFEFASKYNRNAVQGVDICFAKTDIKFPSQKRILRDKIKIGVILRDWNNKTDMDNYVEDTYERLQQFPRDRFDIDYLIFSPNSDSKTIAFLRSKGEEPIFWRPDDDTIEGFLELLNDYNLFLSSRFHGLVFSTLLGKPSIGIEIEPKITLAKENAIVELWRPSSQECLLSLVDNIVSNYHSYQIQCEALIEKNRSSFEELFSL